MDHNLNNLTLINMYNRFTAYNRELDSHIDKMEKLIGQLKSKIKGNVMDSRSFETEKEQIKVLEESLSKIFAMLQNIPHPVKPRPGKGGRANGSFISDNSRYETAKRAYEALTAMKEKVSKLSLDVLELKGLFPASSANLKKVSDVVKNMESAAKGAKKGITSVPSGDSGISNAKDIPVDASLASLVIVVGLTLHLIKKVVDKFSDKKQKAAVA